MPRNYYKIPPEEDLRHRLRAQQENYPGRSHQRDDDIWQRNIPNNPLIFGEQNDCQPMSPAHSNKSHARSREPIRSRSRSRARSKTRGRSRTRARSRTRVRSRTRGRSRTQDCSRIRGRSKTRGRSRSRVHSRSRGPSNRSFSKIKSPSRRSMSQGSTSKRSPSLTRSFTNNFRENSERSKSRSFIRLESPSSQIQERNVLIKLRLRLLDKILSFSLGT